MDQTDSIQQWWIIIKDVITVEHVSPEKYGGEGI